jgi:hypothetical protein
LVKTASPTTTAHCNFTPVPTSLDRGWICSRVGPQRGRFKAVLESAEREMNTHGMSLRLRLGLELPPQ